MSGPFLLNDKAKCMHNGSSTLTLGALYHVCGVEMTRSGEQRLTLTGCGSDGYNACRFVRVPNPAPRKWPKAL